MSRFKAGDRVEVTRDAGPFPCTLGIIIRVKDGHPGSVLRQFTVRLADDTEFDFFDFQLEVPPLTMAMTVIDSTAEPGLSGVRGGPDNRLVRLVGPNFDIHLKIREVGGRKTIMGQISCDPLPDHSLVVLFGDEAMRAATVDNLGEFSFEEVKAERFQLEFLLPKRRILAVVEPR